MKNICKRLLLESTKSWIELRKSGHRAINKAAVRLPIKSVQRKKACQKTQQIITSWTSIRKYGILLLSADGSLYSFYKQYCIIISRLLATFGLTLSWRRPLDFQTPRKHTKTSSVPMLSDGIERNQWHKIVYHAETLTKRQCSLNLSRRSILIQCFCYWLYCCYRQLAQLFYNFKYIHCSILDINIPTSI